MQLIWALIRKGFLVRQELPWLRQQLQVRKACYKVMADSSLVNVELLLRWSTSIIADRCKEQQAMLLGAHLVKEPLDLDRIWLTWRTISKHRRKVRWLKVAIMLKVSCLTRARLWLKSLKTLIQVLSHRLESEPSTTLLTAHLSQSHLQTLRSLKRV